MVSNFEHPVLMKVLAGLTLPREKPAMEIDETRAGRAPMPFVFAGLALVTGLFARALAGAPAGLAAAALVAVEPTLRGHGALVQSDVLVTLFLVAAAFALEHAARSTGEKTRDLSWLLASGVLYGFAMSAKYSAFPFLAVFAAIAAFRLAAGSTGGSCLNVNKEASTRILLFLRDSLRALPKILLVLAIPALVTLFLVQFLAFAATSDAAFQAGIAEAFKGLPQEHAAVALARTLPKPIAAYGAGLLFVRGGAGPGERFNYFFGEVPARATCSISRSLSASSSRRRPSFSFSQRLPRRAFSPAGGAPPQGARRARLLAGALGGAYLLAACASNVNIGVRHAIPVVPFSIAAAAGTLRTLVRRRRSFAIALAAVVLAAGAESVARTGREISFGNLLCGGPSGVPAILSDSNVDWGQEQGRLFERVRHGDLGRVGLVTLIVDESAPGPLESSGR